MRKRPILSIVVVQCVSFVENGSQFVWYCSSMAKLVVYVALVAWVRPMLSLCQLRMVLVFVVHLACGYFAHSSSVTRSFASLQSMGVKNCVVSTVAQLMLFDQSFVLWMRYVRFYVAFLSFLANALVCLLYSSMLLPPLKYSSVDKIIWKNAPVTKRKQCRQAGVDQVSGKSI